MYYMPTTICVRTIYGKLLFETAINILEFVDIELQAALTVNVVSSHRGAYSRT